MPFGHGVCANTIKLADNGTQTYFFSIFALRCFIYTSVMYGQIAINEFNSQRGFTDEQKMWTGLRCTIIRVAISLDSFSAIS